MKTVEPTVNILELQTATVEEKNLDFIPRSFDEYIGQSELKTKLAIYTQAAKMRSEPLDHLLLFGPPGLGKTTLSTIMAQVMDCDIRMCSGPMLERPGDLVSILSTLEKRSILFIDEIHRIPSNVEETLYSAMEQFKVDMIIGQGTGAKSISLPINPFTLIGATTKSGMLSAPLRSRFGITERLDFYNENDLQQIIIQSAQFLGCELEHTGALLIAQAARGTPRIAKKLLRRVRDFCQVQKQPANLANVQKALAFLGIDQEGLTTIDVLLLKTMITHCNGGPVGLETIAHLIGEDPETVEEVYEPFLMRKGYLEKTPRGRQIMPIKLPFLKARFLGQHTIF
ncbi:Holliday junction branch migration DNA helicase RuvB [bacterium]|nr:MAG: Holliday junction branch migration DNA helicase RuvB [bacterium]QQR61700.1 MAG: Holliday junction branch migration DNA helicase RuvB [bacterium]QQR62733.1 MAG: Holliday junction branch migration DNA helicase RuvB [bacterium]